MTKPDPAANEGVSLIVFNIGRQRYALHLSTVDRVLRAMRVTALKNAPGIVSGVINVEGRVIPVVNLGMRFGHDERAICPSDTLILAQTSKRTVAFAVDAVEGMLDRRPEQVQTADSIVPGIPLLEGVAKLEDGLVLIHDLTTLLSLDEERELDVAMK